MYHNDVIFCLYLTKIYLAPIMLQAMEKNKVPALMEFIFQWEESDSKPV